MFLDSKSRLQIYARIYVIQNAYLLSHFFLHVALLGIMTLNNDIDAVLQERKVPWICGKIRRTFYVEFLKTYKQKHFFKNYPKHKLLLKKRFVITQANTNVYSWTFIFF